MATNQHIASASWDVPISRTDHKKLLKGFRPTDMDDKWHLHADGQDTQQDTFVLHICRSWSNLEQMSLTVAQNKITQIHWNIQQEGQGLNFREEDDAKRWAKGMCRRWLGCDLEALDKF